MKSSLDDIALFVQVVKHSNLAGAARYAGLPPATVTRRLQKLEHALGVKLLHRSARKCVLTQDGEAYFDAYAELVERFEAARQQFSSDQTENFCNNQQSHSRNILTLHESLWIRGRKHSV